MTEEATQAADGTLEPARADREAVEAVVLNANASSPTTGSAGASRQVSLIGRREVLTGKAKFGIFGDGKEVAQLAMARAFRKRRLPLRLLPRPDLACSPLGVLTPRAVLRPALRPRRRRARARLGRALDERPLRHPPARRRTARWLDSDGRVQLARPTSRRPASQMPRLVGLAYASKLYRELPGLAGLTPASRATATRSPSARSATPAAPRGMFWEAVNAIGVLQRRRCCSRSGTTATASRCRTSSRSRKGDLSDAARRASSASAGRARRLRPLHACRAGTTRRSCETYRRGRAIVRARARAGDRPRRSS